MEYMINYWFSSTPGVILRTTDKSAFKRKIMELREDYTINNRNARIVYRPDLVIFSFATVNEVTDFGKGRKTPANMACPFFIKPIKVAKAFRENQNGEEEVNI